MDRDLLGWAQVVHKDRVLLDGCRRSCSGGVEGRVRLGLRDDGGVAIDGHGLLGDRHRVRDGDALKSQAAIASLLFDCRGLAGACRHGDCLLGVTARGCGHSDHLGGRSH